MPSTTPAKSMTTNRLEAFSDGVLAIIITIMVLELRVPEGAEINDLRAVITHFAAYIVSFIILGIYWANHHHMLHVSEEVGGSVLWANLHLLFWLSLVPAATAWVGEHPTAPWPAAVYGAVLLGAAIAYFILKTDLIRKNGPDSTLARATGTDFKGKISPILYLAAMLLAFVHPFISYALYITVALMWLLPDRRIEDQID